MISKTSNASLLRSKELSSTSRYNNDNTQLYLLPKTYILQKNELDWRTPISSQAKRITSLISIYKSQTLIQSFELTPAHSIIRIIRYSIYIRIPLVIYKAIFETELITTISILLRKSYRLWKLCTETLIRQSRPK